jgi:hypothetical protein
MKDWYVWETPQHLLAAHENKELYEKAALKRIFGDLVDDTLRES